MGNFTRSVKALLYKGLDPRDCSSLDECVDVTLPFVRLRHKQICHVPTDVVLVADRIATEYLLQSVDESVRIQQRSQIRHSSDCETHILALTSALSQF